MLVFRLIDMNLDLQYVGCYKSLEEVKVKMGDLLDSSRITKRFKKSSNQSVDAKLKISQSGVSIATPTELVADLVASTVCGCFAAHEAFVGVAWTDRVAGSFNFFLFQTKGKLFTSIYSEISDLMKSFFLVGETTADFFQLDGIKFLGKRVLRKHVLRNPQEMERNRSRRYY